MKGDTNFLWNRFTMREAMMLGFCAIFIVLTKAMLRMKLGISGHAMFFSLFFLQLSRGCIPKTGAATLVGLLAGVVSIALGLGGIKGPVIILDFVLAGFVVDVAGAIFPRLPSSYIACVLVGGIAASCKGITSGTIGLLAGAPATVVIRKTLIEGLPAIAFGMLGSLPVPAIIRKLRTNRLLPSGD